MTDKTNPDRARNGYFEVVDRRPVRFGDREEFHVLAYTAQGKLLLHTWNQGEHSMHMEVSALLSRGAYPRGATAETATKIVLEQNARLQRALERQANAKP